MDEAVRGLPSARKEAERAWDVHKHFNHAEALACKLHRAQHAQASAKTIPIDLMAALDLVEHQVARTAREIKVGRCFVGDYAREISGTMGPLLVAAWIAARLQDDFSGDQVCILVDLKAAHDLAKHHAARTAREVKIGRCFAGDVYMRGRGLDIYQDTHLIAAEVVLEPRGYPRRNEQRAHRATNLAHMVSREAPTDLDLPRRASHLVLNEIKRGHEIYRDSLGAGVGIAPCVACTPTPPPG